MYKRQESTIGAKIPPPLAVFEGTIGPKISSVQHIAYPKPLIDLQTKYILNNEILFPSPELITTPAIKKAFTTSQVVESLYPPSAVFNGTKPVRIDNVKPKSTLTAIGIDCNKSEKITPLKIINILYA